MQICCIVAYAQDDVPRVQEDTYVYDQEKLLDSSQYDTLNAFLRYLEQKTTVEFAVVTTPSFKGMDIDDYAHDMFNTLKLGKSNKDNGILLLVSKEEGHARLEIGYGLEAILTDGNCGKILDLYYVPNRDNGKHAESVYDTALGVLAVLGKEYGIEFVGNQEEITREIEKQDSMELILKVIFYIILVIILVALETYLGGGSSRGGYYGGGFSSSGGGHFGGGHSGGGGAHR